MLSNLSLEHKIPLRILLNLHAIDHYGTQDIPLQIVILKQ